MREHVDHAVDAQGIARVDARDPALGDGGRDDAAVGEVGRADVGRVLRRAGDLRRTVDAGRCGAYVSHDGHRIFLVDWLCGVLPTACANARSMARWAKSILKALCAK